MQLQVHKAKQQRPGRITLADDVFAVAYNEPLVHQVVTAYLASGRTVNKSLKNRSAARGGGRKPWRQKGMGRARAGTRRSPLWRGGGVTFAPDRRNHARKVNKKMYRGALRAIFSELIRQKNLICMEEIAVTEAKTKAAVALLATLELRDALIITAEVNRSLHLAMRNLPGVSLIDVSAINPYSLVGFEKVLIDKSALQQVQAWLSLEASGRSDARQDGASKKTRAATAKKAAAADKPAPGATGEAATSKETDAEAGQT